jgi:hypothetical protein
MYPRRRPAGFPTAAMRRTVIRLPRHQTAALRDVSIFFRPIYKYKRVLT